VTRIRLDDATTRAAQDVLSSSELNRLSGFVRASDRARFAQSHALLRRSVADLLGCPLHLVIIDQRCDVCGNQHGAPVVTAPESLYVSLAHTEDTAACVIAREAPVGVDLEPADRAVELRHVRVVLTPAEFRRIEDLPVARRRTELLRLWVRKEAYAKGRGLGVRLPLESIEITETAGALRLAPVGADDGEAARWSVRDVDLGRCLGAIAYRGEISNISIAYDVTEPAPH
jgi:4'-phosphopantetheinyl transferase